MKQVGKEHFEIFVDSVCGSDVLCADTFEEAVMKAYDWSKEIGSELNVVVMRVTEQIQVKIMGKGEKK